MTDSFASAVSLSPSSSSYLSSSTSFTSCFSCPDASSCLLTTPHAVLSLICRHLDVVDLLRLLRSSSHLHRLDASDGETAFSSVAWSEAWLGLMLNQRLHEWLIPRHSCVVAPDVDRVYIPLSLWQQAVPVMHYTLKQWIALDEEPFTTK